MIKSAADYHLATSYDRYDMKGHFIDWENQPGLYKSYAGVEAIPLPKVTEFPEKSLWGLEHEPGKQTDPGGFDLYLLSRIFSVGYSHTAKRPHENNYFYYRSAASAGALYPNEIYLGAYNIKALNHGLYHYDIGNMALTPLRSGDFSRYTAETIGQIDAKELVATFFVTAIFFRSAWKYRARAFRYVLLDAGHILENLILALKAEGLSFTLHYDFKDERLGRLIGLDSRREVCLACINVHGKSSSTSSAHINIEPLTPEFIEAGRVSKHEILYDEIQDIYRAGIGIPEKVETDPCISKDLGVGAGRWIRIDRKKIIKREMGFVESVIKRRSRRSFINRSLSQDVFMRLLDLICFSWDQNSSEERFSSSSITIGFLTDNIEGFQSGFYLMDPLEWKIGLVAEEKLINKMASVCLDQKWLHNACVHFLFVTNLAVIDKNWGSRGYRYAMLNAGRMGQTIYLGATALGLGCCGIGALYDGEAKNLLGLNNESVLLYLVAIGPVTN